MSNTNLIDFKFWTSVSLGDFKFIGANTSSLYTIKSNNILYKIEGSTLQAKSTFPQSVVELKLFDDFVLVSTPAAIYYYDATISLINTFSLNEDFETRFTSALLLNDALYLGTTEFGVLKSDTRSFIGYEEIHPSGPLRNSVFSLEYGYDNLWGTFCALSYKRPRP